MKSFKTTVPTPTGFSNQQALLVLLILFPLGLMAIGSLAVLWLKQPSVVADTPSKPTATEPNQPQARTNSNSNSNSNDHNKTTPDPDLIALQEQRLNDLADAIFWRRHPSLQGVKLSGQTGDLAREWSRIRHCDAIVDDRFYRLHPHMRGRTIQPNQTELAASWQRLRDQVEGCS